MGELLTPQQQQAAVLDAQGFSREETAKAVGISESSLARWRQMEPYREQVSELSTRVSQEMEPLLRRVRVDIVDGARASIDQLRDALEAETKDGDPAWTIRLRAAEMLLQALGEAAFASTTQDSQGASPGSAQAAVIVVQGADEVRGDPRAKAAAVVAETTGKQID